MATKVQLKWCKLVFELALTLVSLIPLPLIISFQFYCEFQRGLRTSPRDTANNNETALNEIFTPDSTIMIHARVPLLVRR